MQAFFCNGQMFFDSTEAQYALGNGKVMLDIDKLVESILVLLSEERGI